MTWVGRVLSPSAIVAAMLVDHELYEAVVSLCEAVMLPEEIAERDCERSRQRHTFVATGGRSRGSEHH